MSPDPYPVHAPAGPGAASPGSVEDRPVGASHIADWHAQAASGKCPYSERLEESVRRAREGAAAHVFTAFYEDTARAAAGHVPHQGLDVGVAAQQQVGAAAHRLGRLVGEHHPGSGRERLAIRGERARGPVHVDAGEL